MVTGFKTNLVKKVLRCSGQPDKVVAANQKRKPILLSYHAFPLKAAVPDGHARPAGGAMTESGMYSVSADTHTAWHA